MIRYQRGSCSCWCNRGSQASVRHLGKHSQRCQQNGQHWSSGKNTGETNKPSFKQSSTQLKQTNLTSLASSSQVTEDVFRLLSGYYNFQCRGQVSVKGKGQMLTYFLEGRTTQGAQHPRSKIPECGSSPCIRTKLGSAPAVSSYGVKSHTVGHISTPNNSILYLPSVSVDMEV